MIYDSSMIKLSKKSETEEEQMMKDVFVEKAWTIIRGNLSGKVLDLGCGPGQITYSYRDSIRVDIQRTRAPSPFVTADACRLPFKDASFDTVVCINFLLNLESIESVKRILAEMKRVCRKSGRVIFEFRNSRNMLFVLKYRLARYYDASVDRLCLNTYNPGQIESILKDLGLIIINRRFIGFPLKRFAPVIFIEAEKIC